MKQEKVEEILIKIAREEGPGQVDLWPKIRQSVSPKQENSKRRLIPHTRLGWAVFMTMILLLTTTAVFAVDSIVHRALQEDPGLESAQLKARGQEINQVNTINGFTVTLQWVYADDNRVAMGFSIQGPSEVSYNSINTARMQLTDDRGNIYPSFNGFGTPYETGSTALASSFSVPSAAKPLPETLKLHLSMYTVAVDPTRVVLLPTVAPGESKEQTLENSQPGPVSGPFTFDFDVKPQPGSVLALDQVVESHGIPMTLKNVSITPSETQGELCYGGSDIQDWAPIFHLDVGTPLNWDKVSQGTISIPGAACNTVHINAPLLDYKGLWTLTVSEIVGFAPDGSSTQKRLAGPWVFRFERK
jgi:hypothetical protein